MKIISCFMVKYSISNVIPMNFRDSGKQALKEPDSITILTIPFKFEC